MGSEHHLLMGGKLHVYRRENSSLWQCAAYIGGKNRRVSTKEDSLALAKEFAEDWYLELRGKNRAGELKAGKTFKQAAEQFIHEFQALTAGERSAKYVQTLILRIRVHLIPFFGTKVVSEVTTGLVQEYRIHRMTSRLDRKTGQPKRPSRSSLNAEIIALRQVLKTANRQGWLPILPDLSAPFRASSKISHRAWFSPDEYKQLYEATRARANATESPRRKFIRNQLHDFVLFMANTGLRPDEAARLEFRDVVIATDEATGERILEIEVRGKRGVGHCKSMPGAILPFERIAERTGGKPAARIFGKLNTDLLNRVLGEIDLKFDRDGNARTAYSLRHTYICFRLMEGADIYQVAKNCRTSVEMIEKYYASHLKNTIDASAVNVRRTQVSPQKAANQSRKARRTSPRPQRKATPSRFATG